MKHTVTCFPRIAALLCFVFTATTLASTKCQVTQEPTAQCAPVGSRDVEGEAEDLSELLQFQHKISIVSNHTEDALKEEVEEDEESESDEREDILDDEQVDIEDKECQDLEDNEDEGDGDDFVEDGKEEEDDLQEENEDEEHEDKEGKDLEDNEDEVDGDDFVEDGNEEEDALQEEDEDEEHDSDESEDVTQVDLEDDEVQDLEDDKDEVDSDDLEEDAYEEDFKSENDESQGSEALLEDRTDKGLNLLKVGTYMQGNATALTAKASLQSIEAAHANGSLSVKFHHDEYNHHFELMPYNIYTDDADVRDGEDLLEAKPSTTYRSHGVHGKWAAASLHEDGSIHGLFVHGERLIEITPVRDIEDADSDGHLASLLEGSAGSLATHRVQWVMESELPLVLSEGRRRRRRRRKNKNKRNKNKKSKNKKKKKKQVKRLTEEEEKGNIPRDTAGQGARIEEYAAADGVSEWGGTKWAGKGKCFKGDSEMHEIKVGIYSDQEAYKREGSRTKSLLESYVNQASFVYEMQMHIALKIGDMKVNMAEFGRCKSEALIGRVEDMIRLLKKKAIPKMAASHVITLCRASAGGLASVGTLCGPPDNVGVEKMSSRGWIVFAHELGHNFGAGHTFEEGQSRTGGIMDYGDGKLRGHYQFHTKYRKKEVCKLLNSKVGKCFGKFQKESGSARRRTSRKVSPIAAPAPNPFGPNLPNIPGLIPGIIPAFNPGRNRGRNPLTPAAPPNRGRNRGRNPLTPAAPPNRGRNRGRNPPTPAAPPNRGRNRGRNRGSSRRSKRTKGPKKKCSRRKKKVAAGAAGAAPTKAPMQPPKAAGAAGTESFTKLAGKACGWHGTCGRGRNKLKIGAKPWGDQIRTLEEIQTVCFSKCLSSSKCGGFVYWKKRRRCYYKKNTKCGLKNRSNKDCYQRIS